MRLLQKSTRWLALPLAVVMLVASSGIGPARAGIVATEDVARSESAASDRTLVLSFLEREDVRRQMVALGIAPDEAARRVAGLSDAEVAAVAERIDQMPAGQSAVGVIVGAALIVFIILLITDIAGLTDVFPFTR